MKNLFFIFTVLISSASFASQVKYTGSLPLGDLPKGFPYEENTCILNITTDDLSGKITEVYAYASQRVGGVGFYSIFAQVDDQRSGQSGKGSVSFDAELTKNDMGGFDATSVKELDVILGQAPASVLSVSNYGKPDMTYQITQVIAHSLGSWTEKRRCINFVPAASAAN